MSWVKNYPEGVVRSVVAEWLSLKDLGKLDCAYTNKAERPLFLSHLPHVELNHRSYEPKLPGKDSKQLRTRNECHMKFLEWTRLRQCGAESLSTGLFVDMEVQYIPKLKEEYEGVTALSIFSRAAADNKKKASNLKNVFDVFPNLEVLVLTCVEVADFKAITELAEDMDLKEVHMLLCPDDAELQVDLLSSCADTVRGFYSMESWDYRLMETMCINCPCLTDLECSFFNTKGITAAKVRDLLIKHCGNLEKLTFKEMPTGLLNQTHVTEITSHLTKLTEFHILHKNGPRMSLSAINTVLSHCPQLAWIRTHELRWRLLPPGTHTLYNSRYIVGPESGSVLVLCTSEPFASVEDFLAFFERTPPLSGLSVEGAVHVDALFALGEALKANPVIASRLVFLDFTDQGLFSAAACLLVLREVLQRVKIVAFADLQSISFLVQLVLLEAIAMLGKEQLPVEELYLHQLDPLENAHLQQAIAALPQLRTVYLTRLREGGFEEATLILAAQRQVRLSTNLKYARINDENPRLELYRRMQAIYF